MADFLVLNSTIYNFIFTVFKVLTYWSMHLNINNLVNTYL